MTRRISIARNGVVKLDGQATRWRIRQWTPGGSWWISLCTQLSDAWVKDKQCATKEDALTHLATLTDAELRE